MIHYVKWLLTIEGGLHQLQVGWKTWWIIPAHSSWTQDTTKWTVRQLSYRKPGPASSGLGIMNSMDTYGYFLGPQ